MFMKKLPILLSAMAALGVYAETPQTSDSLEAWSAQRVLETPPTIEENKPNEIQVGNLSYSGITVQVVKIRNPFQLINPLAPMEYGLAEANVVREPDGGRISGLKIFSIQF